MSYKPVGVAAWSYLAGFVGPYHGFGLATAGADLVTALANAGVNVYIDGSATATTTSTIPVTDTNMVTDLDADGLSAIDFEIEYKQRSVSGGKKMIAPIEIGFNARKVTGS